MYKLPSRPPATNEGLIASQLLSDAIPGQDACFHLLHTPTRRVEHRAPASGQYRPQIAQVHTSYKRVSLGA